MTSLQIVSGPVVYVVGIVALVLFVSMVVRNRASARTIAFIAAFSCVVGAAIWVSVATIPGSFALCAAFVTAAVAVGGMGWRQSSPCQRVRSFTAIVAVIIASGLVVNVHYGYYPTVADLLGRPLPDQIATDELGRVGPFGAGSPVSTSVVGPSGTEQHRTGRLVRVRIAPTTSRFGHRAEWVYLPPAWFRVPKPRLPVIVLLPGTPGTTEDWIRAGSAVRTANRWAAAHLGRAPVLVFADPNGAFRADTECVDTPNARVDTYLSVDLPSFVASTFATSTDPARWAIAGVSAGGTCAVTVALRHPDVYRTLVSLSGEVTPNVGGGRKTLRHLFGGSSALAASYDPLALLARHDYPSTHAWFAAAAGDRPARRALDGVSRAARRAGVDTTTNERRHGGHTWRFWRAAFADAFPWLSHVIDAPGATHG